jgi:hypothetical protein
MITKLAAAKFVPERFFGLRHVGAQVAGIADKFFRLFHKQASLIYLPPPALLGEGGVGAGNV